MEERTYDVPETETSALNDPLYDTMEGATDFARNSPQRIELSTLQGSHIGWNQSVSAAMDSMYDVPTESSAVNEPFYDSIPSEEDLNGLKQNSAQKNASAPSRGNQARQNQVGDVIMQDLCMYDLPTEEESSVNESLYENMEDINDFEYFSVQPVRQIQSKRKAMKLKQAGGVNMETSEMQHIYDPVNEVRYLDSQCEKDVSLSKSEQKQKMAIEELISTERGYVTSLQLCANDIRNNLKLKQLPDLDVERTFSNIDEVLEVSTRLLQNLEDTVPHQPIQLILISQVFLDFKEDLVNVYKEYCANYETTIVLESNYKQNETLQLEIFNTLTEVVPQSGASTLSFFLVMPVQRIGKYPLLLKQIRENTDPEDNAYPLLQKAEAAVLDANVQINEYKRFKDVANKYIKAEQLTIMEKIARLNKHSIAKKTSRISQLIKHETGFRIKTEDKQYDELEEKFDILRKNIIELKENMETYLKYLEVFLQFKPHEINLDINDEAVLGYQQFSQKLSEEIFPKFKRRLESIVYKPLCILVESLEGPQNLIKKRLDKLLDYEKIQEKISESGDVTYEEKDVMNTYKAINTLLISELPKCCEIATQLLIQILQSFAVCQRDASEDVQKVANGYISELPHSHLPETQFWTVIEDMLQSYDCKLGNYRKTFEATVVPSPVSQANSPESQRRIQSLKTKFGPERLFLVTSDITGNKDLDLSVKRGDIVAVIQEGDTKGNKLRWLVDAEGRRGYVSATKLVQCRLAQDEKLNPQTLIIDDNLERRRHSYQFATPSTHVEKPFKQMSLDGAQQRRLAETLPRQTFQNEMPNRETVKPVLATGGASSTNMSPMPPFQSDKYSCQMSTYINITERDSFTVPTISVQNEETDRHTLQAETDSRERKQFEDLMEMPSSMYSTCSPTPLVKVFAGYDFQARNPHELSLKEGQEVKLLESHDKKGNPEWSLVEVNGHQGYVPSNYLMMTTVSPVMPAARSAHYGWSIPLH
ncbi:rho guanine nucleotide exchange factor 37 [Protopterus annectens]|uniref:rho guanine nucleotide exchange factor 37 n=1 Tax=Protopterus annectens TaxID=7888 RepID=UPI001CFBDF78|nr:rho guanine nucleotide exchange factor 37 [Protopterus annectens]XP_043923676.1 rho guanine nucleotide exchange factor 37 [Protopterus annectens]